MLCSRCEVIFNKPFFSKYDSSLNQSNLSHALSDYIVHHRSPESFGNSLKLNCGVCKRIVRKSLTRSNKRFANEDGLLDPDIDPDTFIMSWRMSFQNQARTIVEFSSLASARKSGKPWNTKTYLQLYRSEEQKPIPELSIAPPVRSDEQAVFSLITNWISECQHSHPRCHASSAHDSESSFARILDVGIDKRSKTVRLCEAYEVPNNAPYLTLSHCWGKADIPVLSKATYSEFLVAISIEDLPQTFADAIRLTRELKFGYLWIDSLCIVQDSEEDWLDQSVKMDRIYHGSACNIAASRSKDPFGGLFSSRDPALITPCRILTNECPELSTEAWYDVDDDFTQEWTTQITHSPVCQRGWVLQERLLAPRVVHFCNNQLFWECVERQTREGDALAGIRDPNSTATFVNFKNMELFSHNLSHEPTTEKAKPNYVWFALRAMNEQISRTVTKKTLRTDPRALSEAQRVCFGGQTWRRSHQLLTYWAEIVTIYHSLALTREDDRLVAITGLAKILRDGTRIRYVAGHWDYQLPRQLLWTPRYETVQSRERYHGYIAPSWSWASCYSRHVGNLKLEEILEQRGAMDLVQIKAVEAKGIRGESTPMDKLESGYLRLRGRLIPVNLDVSNWPGPTERERYLIQYWQTSVPESPQGQTFLVPILFMKNLRKLPKFVPNCLLLEATGKKGTYRRVGTARLNHLYPLAWIVPDLYSVKTSAFEDPENLDNPGDDDSDGETQGEPSKDSNVGRSQAGNTSSSREELKAIRASQLQSRQVSDLVQKLGSRMRSKAKSPAQYAALSKVISVYNETKDRLPQPPPRPENAPITFTPEMVKEIEENVRADTGIDVHVAVGSSSSTPEQNQGIRPKDAVNDELFLEYIDDEDSVAYGHFIFDII